MKIATVIMPLPDSFLFFNVPVNKEDSCAFAIERVYHAAEKNLSKPLNKEDNK